MSTTKRALGVGAVLLFLVGGLWFVAWASSRQEALEAPPQDVAAELAAMAPVERAFIREVSSVATPLDDYPLETLRMGYKACAMGALPEYQIRDQLIKLSRETKYEFAKTQALIFWYRAKDTICAPKA